MGLKGMEVEKCMIHKASHPQEQCFLLQRSTAACFHLHQPPVIFLLVGELNVTGY